MQRLRQEDNIKTNFEHITSSSAQGPVADFCAYSNKFPSSLKDGKFVEELAERLCFLKLIS